MLIFVFFLQKLAYLSLADGDAKDHTVFKKVRGRNLNFNILDIFILRMAKNGGNPSDGGGYTRELT